MARTKSLMRDLGTTAPEFTLPDVITGKSVSLADTRGPKGLLVMFLCAHCPFVKHLEQAIADFASEYSGKGIGIVAISSNDAVAYPDDAPNELAGQARRLNFTFPYLYDESQQTARDHHAACTPDFFLYDANLSLIYRGQFDGSRPGNGIPPTGKDLRAAFDAVLAGQPVNPDQIPSLGCNIKWKA
ncbi:MAG: thioredoxin family protein [Acidobacteriaceae bacterium]